MSNEVRESQQPAYELSEAITDPDYWPDTASVCRPSRSVGKRLRRSTRGEEVVEDTFT